MIFNILCSDFFVIDWFSPFFFVTATSISAGTSRLLVSISTKSDFTKFCLGEDLFFTLADTGKNFVANRPVVCECRAFSGLHSRLSV